jgi:hypothetical protein
MLPDLFNIAELRKQVSPGLHSKRCVMVNQNRGFLQGRCPYQNLKVRGTTNEYSSAHTEGKTSW